MCFCNLLLPPAPPLSPQPQCCSTPVASSGGGRVQRESVSFWRRVEENGGGVCYKKKGRIRFVGGTGVQTCVFAISFPRQPPRFHRSHNAARLLFPVQAEVD